MSDPNEPVRPEPVVPLTLSIGQVAETLGLSEPTFRKKRRELEALGFPKKLPGLTAWSRPAIRHWFDTNGGLLALAPIDPTIGVALVEATRELESEYAA